MLHVGFNLFTHIGDPHGHSLVEEVEDHDDDKVDAGGGDRGRQLWSDEPAHHLDLPLGVFDDAREGSIHSQPVRYDPGDTSHDQGNLWTSTHTHTRKAADGEEHYSPCITVYSNQTGTQEHSVTQNKTVADERQKRAHLLVTGRYGSIS